MKIFYAIQATGNGHISRAMELLPHLERYGTVDIFLSGANSSLSLDAPVKYRSMGLSLFYNCTGGLDYWRMMKGYSPFKLKKEVQELPVEKYDLVINDFEYITAASCAKKKIPSVQFGHQASFQSSKTPRPANKSSLGEWLLKNYAKATQHIGLHFEKYDEFIFHPVIKKEILEAESIDENYITFTCLHIVNLNWKKFFIGLKEFKFQIFSKETSQPRPVRISRFLPVDRSLFNQSLIHCTGSLPAEALKLPQRLFTSEKNNFCS
jgi:uncharacterized protein (TIGR00661 family)